ncbi:putative MFS family arabinose efflux permease [Saccharothrix ecbatanensis]|uniref:Putative MFS family arabinose efflux permease n=1 Tax=Saccharothrix ecbatanensis TaxID=1105145 RepID=A0A7W9HKE1_9PSEU|nr:putative MFS family arabinose efflux permease [Saccharothrix ecbatanensis]
MKALLPVRIMVDNPRIRPVLLWSFLARLPLGMVFEALLFGVQKATGSLQLAGVVTATAAVSTAVGAPVQGRMLDRFDKKRVVRWFAVAQVLSLAALSVVTAWDRLPETVLIVLAVAVGFTIPALSAMTRLVLKNGTAAGDLNAAFSLDATTLEFIFIIGPAIAAWGVVVAGPSAVFGASAVCVLAGTAFFLLSADNSWFTTGVSSEAGESSGEKAGRKRVRPGRAVAWFVPSIVLCAIPLGVAEAGLIQLTVERGDSIAPVGIVLSLLGVGSLVGGLVFAAVRWNAKLSVQFVLLSVAHFGILALLITRPNYVVAGVIVTLAGLFVVPLLSLTSQLLDRLSPPEAWSESQSWGGAGNTAGSAIGLTLGGVVAGVSGSLAGFVVAVVIAVVGIVVALPAFRGGQDLSGTVVTPEKVELP